MRRSSGDGSPLSRDAGARWRRLAALVRAARAPWRCSAFGALYLLAVAEAPRALARFRAVDAARAEDLASGLLLRALLEIVAAEHPLRYFRVALRREAISWARRGGSAVAAEGAAAWDGGPLDDPECRAIYRVDARRRFVALSARERVVLVAVAQGAEREEVARALGTSRANVDQIVHRARSRGTSERGGLLRLSVAGPEAVTAKRGDLS